MKSVFENDYPNPHTLEELELELGISKYRLCRDFSKYMQKSPIQYLNQIRLEAAMELLTTTDLAVHMISSAVGIPNTSYFIHLFSREYGITPLQYRQAHSQQL